jgi:hypothetical protein
MSRRRRARRSPKRRRARAPLNWPAVLWVLALANVAAGLAFSPVTSVRKVRVTGAAPTDHARIEAFSQVARGTPALRLTGAKVESLAQANPAVARAEFRRNVFGRGVLEIEMRRPVAAMAGEVPTLLADDGTVYPGSAPAGLPRVRLAPALRAPNLALIGLWESQAIAVLCHGLAARFPEIRWTVEVDARGVINLGQPRSGRIVLGSSERLDEKLAALERVIADRPGFLAQVQELNLTVPTNPVFIPAP